MYPKSFTPPKFLIIRILIRADRMDVLKTLYLEIFWALWKKKTKKQTVKKVV